VGQVALLAAGAEAGPTELGLRLRDPRRFRTETVPSTW
jgi:hypothetical protein